MMDNNYDNWERLVNAVLRRERDRELALIDSTDISSIGSPSSTASSFNYISVSSRFDYGHSQKNKIPMHHSDLKLHHTEWKAMLPPHKHEVIWRSASLGFFLDWRTAKNCFILGAMKLELSRVGSDGYLRYWKCESHPKSRFSKVVELVHPSRFYVRGRINTNMLSPETFYSAYLVYRFTESFQNPNTKIASFTFTLSSCGGNAKQQKRVVPFQSWSRRAGGWMELELGSFYVVEGKNRMILAECAKIIGITDVDIRLIVEGIEFRPSRISSKA